MLKGQRAASSVLIKGIQCIRVKIDWPEHAHFKYCRRIATAITYYKNVTS